MKAFIGRYLVPYLCYTGTFLAWWIFTICMYGGSVVPWVFGFAFIVSLFLTLPMLIYADYRSAWKYAKELYVLHQKEDKKAEAYLSLGSTIAQQFGLPEFLCEMAVKKIVGSDILNHIKTLKA